MWKVGVTLLYSMTSIHVLAFQSSFLRFGRQHVRQCERSIGSRRRSKDIGTRFFSNAIEDMEGWTIEKTIHEMTRKLENQNVQDPMLSVQHLLSSSLNLGWENGFRQVLSIRNDRRLTKTEASDFGQKLQRRLRHEPLQYILGRWDFLDYTIVVKSPLLCPRPETEELVMMIVEDTTESPIHILDIGAGTGVIGISLAEKLPDATVEAIDIEPVAVQVSKENAELILGSQASCYNVHQNSVQDFSPKHHFDIVVSNPPYIPEADMLALSPDVVDFESRDALCGGDDGLDVVRNIVDKLPKWCNSGAVCWLEVDPTHPTMIEDMLKSNSMVGYELSFKDLFGLERFVKLKVL